MIKKSLWQAKRGPRLLIEVGWTDELDPQKFARIARELLDEWPGTWRTVVRWHLRDDVFIAEFPSATEQQNPRCQYLDAREIARRPRPILLAMIQYMVREAIAKDVVRYLPMPCAIDEAPSLILGLDGRPLKR